MNEITARLNSGCELSYLEENMQFVLDVGKFYDECLNSKDNKKNEIINCYQFFTKYFLIYMAKKYNKSFKYELASNTEDTFYRHSDNSINISKYSIGKDFQVIVFKIFHEFKHKMQWDDMAEKGKINTTDKLLDIDPATIIFLKEIFTMNDKNLYRKNHDCFTMEHDANLFSISECKKLFKTNFIERIYSGELTNYIQAMVEGLDLSDKEYHDKQNLPIIYEQDYRAKKYFAGKQTPSNSLLSLIYKTDGTPKSYDELLSDKSKLLEKYKDQIIDRKTSSINYQESRKSSKEHIEEIYKLIVASDPILTIQECLYKWNSIENKMYAKQYMNKIIKLLDDCPQLSTIYFNEIKSILLNELKKGNVEAVENIVNQNDIFKPAINFYIQSQSKGVSTSSDEHEMNEFEKQEKNPRMHR